MEGAFLLQAAVGVAQPLELRPPTLAAQALLSDVLVGSKGLKCYGRVQNTAGHESPEEGWWEGFRLP